MEWTFFLPLISFFGLIIGIILAKISPEEIEPGKKIFKILQHLFLLVIIVFLIYYSKNIFVIILGLIIGYFLRYEYLYLGLALATSFLFSNESLFIIASLIFLYGVPHGTLLVSDSKIKKSLVFSFIIFLVPFIFLFFPKIISPEILFGFTAGLLTSHFKCLIASKNF